MTSLGGAVNVALAANKFKQGIREDPGNKPLFFKVALGGHLAGTGLAAACLGISYLGQTDTDTYNLELTLNAVGGFIALAGGLLSLLNFVVELWQSTEGKIKLEVQSTNAVRNLLSTLILVISTVLAGYTGSTDWYYWLAAIGAMVAKLADVQLDTGNFFAVQCLEESSGRFESGKGGAGKSTMKALFVFVCLAAVIVALVWYSIDVQPLDEMEGDDSAYYIIVLIGTSLHTFLILLQLLIMNVGAIANAIKGALAWISKSETCEEDSVHMINEIPVVSKIVFTLNMFFLSLITGERIEGNFSVALIATALASLCLADIVGKNEV